MPPNRRNMTLKARLERVLSRARLYRPARRAYRRLRGLQDDRALLRRFAPRGSLVFDVGANRGDMTDVFLSLRARVVAVEPTPELAALIERRYRCRRLRVEACAVGDRPGTATLRLGSYDQHSTLSAEWAALVPDRWRASVAVPVVTLDQLIAKHGVPAFVKLDVEGYERQALAGLTRPIPALSFEFRRAMADDARACMERLLELGEYEFAFAPLREWSGPDRIMEQIAAAGAGVSGDVYARVVAQAP